MSALTASPVSSAVSRTASSKRAAYASFKPAVNSRSLRSRVNASIREVQEQQHGIDRRQMLAFSAVLPLMLQQSAQADEGERPS
jgi:hypothetical protein